MLQVYEEMKKSLRQMRRILNLYEIELSKLPLGSLSMRKQNSKFYYYCNIWSGERRQKFYLNLSSKSDQNLLKKLQRRRFIQKCLPILKADIAALQQAINKFTPYDPNEIFKSLTPAYRGIQQDPTLWLPAEPDLKRWAKEPYPKYSGYPQGLVHETSTGLMVRSKSESMIADTLTLFGIPFRYEQIIMANNKTYAPDFTMLHPVTKKLMYWEHFGKMDAPDYVFENVKKIMDYRQVGIRVGTNLIITFENKEHPLTMREIQDIITLLLL